MDLVSRLRFEVATWSVLFGAETTSRHGFEVATWFSLEGVTTWISGRGSGRRRCTQRARDLERMRERPVGCARCSTHDLGTARAVCTRPGFWVCVLCTQPSFGIVHCSGHCFGTLFMDTVHEHCSQGFKKKTQILKIFLCMI